MGRVASLTPSDFYPFSSQAPSSLRRTLFFDQSSWLPDNLLERGGRMMATLNRRQNAVHGCGVGECRSALPGPIPGRSQGREGCVARKHEEALTS